MITNTDITVYSRCYKNDGDTWTRTYVPSAWWFRNSASTATTGGIKDAGSCIVRIPDLSVSVKKDDYIVKGQCDVTMATVKDLAGLDVIKVTGANYNVTGGNPHIKVVGV